MSERELMEAIERLLEELEELRMLDPGSFDASPYGGLRSGMRAVLEEYFR